jgi:hypothetical protein
MSDYNLVNKKIAERLEYFNKLDEKEKKSKKCVVPLRKEKDSTYRLV